MKTLLVTGGCGFIGSHFIRHILESRPGLAVINFDNLSYAGDKARLRDLEKNSRYDFIKGDLKDIKSIKKALGYGVDFVVHFAAESHVDNSIRDPFIFEEANTRGTLNLLSVCHQAGVKKILHFSTDEVYGDIRKGEFSEDSPMAPNSPYSASKAASDLFVRAFVRTYKLPAFIVRCCNNYGPWQYPEKLIPVVVSRAMDDRMVPVYARGLNVREWIYVSDCVSAAAFLLDKGKPGEVYNIGSGHTRRNIDLVKSILCILNKPQSLIRFVDDRPGHDWRYALDFSKLKKLGWRPKVSFQDGLRWTVDWYVNNKRWVDKKLGAC